MMEEIEFLSQKVNVQVFFAFFHVLLCHKYNILIEESTYCSYIPDP